MVDDFDIFFHEWNLIYSLTHVFTKYLKWPNESEEGIHIPYAKEEREYRKVPIIGVWHELVRKQLPFNEFVPEKNYFLKFWVAPEYQAYNKSFCEKYNIKKHIYLRCQLADVNQESSPEKYLNKWGHGKTKTLTFHREFVITNSVDELKQIEKYYLSATKDVLFQAGEPFLEKIRSSSSLTRVMCLFDSAKSVYGGLNYAITNTGIDHPVDDIDHVSRVTNFSTLGLKPLSSLRECAGLGFAIAEKLGLKEPVVRIIGMRGIYSWVSFEQKVIHHSHPSKLE